MNVPVEIDAVTFETEYVPVPKDDGGRVREYLETKSMEGHHVWTLIPGDNEGIYAVAGYALADNRIGYVLTEKPWVTRDETAVWVDATEVTE